MGAILKKCFKCGHLKELSGFYRHPQMADGHLNKCVECTKRDVTAHRVKNHARLIEYDRGRYRNDEGRRKRTAETMKQARKKDPKRYAGYSYAKRRRNPHKYRANRILAYHVKRGHIDRRPCEECGAEPAQAHHDDYSKPLEVRWLCPAHHGLHHRKK